MAYSLSYLLSLKTFRPAASAIVKSSFREPPKDTSLLGIACWEDSRLCMFVETDDLFGFFERLLLQVSQNGGNAARLEYIREPWREPKRWLQTPASLLVGFVQNNLESADFEVRAKANDPDALRELEYICSIMKCPFPL